MKNLTKRLICLGVLCIGLAVSATTDVSANKQCGIVCVTYYTKCTTSFNPNTARCEPTASNCWHGQFCDDPAEFILLPPQP